MLKQDVYAGTATKTVKFTIVQQRGESQEAFDARLEREQLVARHRAEQLS